MKNSYNNLKLTQVFLLIFAVTFSNFSLQAEVNNEPADNKPIFYSNIRVLHLSPDAPPVDVWVNKQFIAVKDLGFLEGTEYFEIQSGLYTFDLSPANTSIKETVLTHDFILNPLQDYSVFAVNYLTDIELLALQDDNSGLKTNTIRLRPVHAAPNVPSVDIWLIPDNGLPIPLWTDLKFRASGEYLEIPAGAYTLGFDANKDASPDIVFDLPAIPEGTIANVFAVNNEQGNVFLVAHLQNGTTVNIYPRQEVSRVRVVHLSPDAPPVDVWLDKSDPIVSNVHFGQGSEYLTLNAKAATFDIAPAGTHPKESVLSFNDIMLDPDTDYTAVAYNFLNDLSGLAMVDDNSAVEPGFVRLRAVHTAAKVGSVDILLLQNISPPVILWPNLKLGDVGDYIEVPAKAYTIGFDVNTDGKPDVIYDIPSLPSGDILNIYAVQDESQSVFLLAQTQDNTFMKINARREPATLRVVHLSPDAPPVDVYNGLDDKIASDVSFTEGTSSIPVNDGVNEFLFFPSGVDTKEPILKTGPVFLKSEKTYSAVAYGTASDLQAILLEDDISSLNDGYTRIRAIHTAWGVGKVDIWNVADFGIPALLWSSLEFGQAGKSLDVPASSYSIGFDVDADKNVDLLFDLPKLLPGTIINIFAVTDKYGSPLLILQLPEEKTVRLDPRSLVTVEDITLRTPAEIFPGDIFSIDAEVLNSGESGHVAFVAVLDLGNGNFRFFPNWTDTFDYLPIQLETGQTAISVIPELVWPDSELLDPFTLTVISTVIHPDTSRIIGPIENATIALY
ncbi:DUF4397 domain-containing protein [bacterium]|nr:DUF4397 domain-containing protein [candidate division CSSED10-310 bacterium]